MDGSTDQTGTQSIKVEAVDIPGLVNIELPDGRRLYDMTIGQTESIARRYGWRIELDQASEDR